MQCAVSHHPPNHPLSSLLMAGCTYMYVAIAPGQSYSIGLGGTRSGVFCDPVHIDFVHSIDNIVDLLYMSVLLTVQCTCHVHVAGLCRVGSSTASKSTHHRLAPEKNSCHCFGFPIWSSRACTKYHRKCLYCRL